MKTNTPASRMLKAYARHVDATVFRCGENVTEEPSEEEAESIFYDLLACERPPGVTAPSVEEVARATINAMVRHLEEKATSENEVMTARRLKMTLPAVLRQLEPVYRILPQKDQTAECEQN